MFNADTTSFIAPVSWGLGDLIVSLPAVQALIDAGTRTHLVVRSEQQVGLAERIPGLAGTVQEAELESRLKQSNAKYINLRNHPIQTGYWWGGPEFERDYPNFFINDILKLICQDFGINADFEHLKPLNWEKRNDIQGRVVFVPGSDGTYKCWPKEHWLQLNRELSKAGRECLMLGQPENSEIVKSLIDAGISWIETHTLAEAIDVVSSAALVIGVDTGLMHLAVQQSTPTICLYRHDPIYYRQYSSALHLVAPPCHSECTSKSNGSRYEAVTSFTDWTPGTWTCSLPENERCMSAIRPELVLETALNSLKETRVCS